MSKIGKSLTSTIRYDRGKSFSRAQNRFTLIPQHVKLQSPPPTSYNIPDSIGYHDERRAARPFVTSNMRRTVFGREDRSSMFDKIILPSEIYHVPGPGSYAHYTGFDNDEKFNIAMNAASRLSPSKGSKTAKNSPLRLTQQKNSTTGQVEEAF